MSPTCVAGLQHPRTGVLQCKLTGSRPPAAKHLRVNPTRAQQRDSGTSDSRQGKQQAVSQALKATLLAAALATGMGLAPPDMAAFTARADEEAYMTPYQKRMTAMERRKELMQQARDRATQTGSSAEDVGAAQPSKEEDPKVLAANAEVERSNEDRKTSANKFKESIKSQLAEYEKRTATNNLKVSEQPEASTPSWFKGLTSSQDKPAEPSTSGDARPSPKQPELPKFEVPKFEAPKFNFSVPRFSAPQAPSPQADAEKVEAPEPFKAFSTPNPKAEAPSPATEAPSPKTEEPKPFEAPKFNFQAPKPTMPDVPDVPAAPEAAQKAKEGVGSFWDSLIKSEPAKQASEASSSAKKAVEEPAKKAATEAPKAATKAAEPVKQVVKNGKRKGPLPLFLAQFLVLGVYGGLAYLIAKRPQPVLDAIRVANSLITSTYAKLEASLSSKK